MNYNGSGKNCSVLGCSNNYRKRRMWSDKICEKHNLAHKDCPCLVPFSLHAFPKDEDLRRKWSAAISRKDFQPGKYAVVCSQHFVDGIPTEVNPVPQLNLGYQRKVCFGRPVPKRRLTTVLETEDTNGESAVDEQAPISEAEQSQASRSVSTQADTPKMVDQGTQWEDPFLRDHDYCKDRNMCQINRGTQVSMKSFSFDLLTNVDCKFYTGLNLPLFLNLVSILSTCTSFSFGLDVGNQLLLVLMRLRLGLIFSDLARRFEISTSLCCKIFSSWLPVLSKELKFLVCWLSRETLRLTLPDAFKTNYPKTTCIIDCTEIFINRPNLLNTRAQTYSSYKHHNTVKTMVCIAPCGYFMFVSSCFGGRTSDKFIVTSSGVLDYLLPGDEVMADRGFTIDLEVATKQAKLNIPCFTKGKTQLTDSEVTSTRRIASVRVHVERAIGRNCHEY